MQQQTEAASQQCFAAKTLFFLNAARKIVGFFNISHLGNVDVKNLAI